MAKYISGKVKDLNVGISNYSENKTSVTVIGNVGIGTLVPTDEVGSGNTAVLAAGIVSAYQFYGDGQYLTNVGGGGNTSVILADSLDVLGITTLRGTLSVGGISTFSSAIDANGDLDVDGHTELDNVNVSGFSTFNNHLVVQTAGVTTFYNTLPSDFSTHGSVVMHGGLGVSKMSNFGDGLNVIGHTELDNINVSGISTLGGTLSVAGVSTFSDDIDANADVNIAGVATVSSLVGISGSLTNITVTGIGTFSELYVTGVTTAGIITGATYYGDGSNLSGIMTSGGIPGIDTTGTSTFETIIVNGNAGIGSLNVTGISTLGGTLSVAGISTFNNQVTIDGTNRLRIGNGNAAIYRDSSDLVIDVAGNHDMYLKANTGGGTGGNIHVQAKTGEDNIVANSDGSVEIYHDNAKKLESTTDGIDVTGHTETDTLNVSGITTLGGNVFLGDGGGDQINVNGNFISGLNPLGYGQYDLGTPGQYWKNLYLSDRVEANVGILTHLEVSGVSTFSGDVSIGGTLTYEDVTNVDSIGLITARDGLHVTGGVSTFAGNINANGYTYLNGNVNLGNATSDYINVGGRFLSDVTPSSSWDYNLGQADRQWQTLFSKQLKISGISTLGITSTTWLESEQLNVTGVSTFAGIVTATSLYTKQLSLTGVSTYGPEGALEIYSNYESSTGGSYLKTNVGGFHQGITASWGVYNSDLSTHRIEALDTSVDLYWTGTKKFSTTGYGVTVFGTTDTQQLNVSGVTTAGIITGATYYGDGSNLTGITTTGAAGGWNPDSQYNLYAGTGAGAASDADTCYNVAIGYSAGLSACAGWKNVFIGAEAGKNVKAGGCNVFLGGYAGAAAGDTGSLVDNIAIGKYAGACLNDTYFNIIIGMHGGQKVSTGHRNILIGKMAGCEGPMTGQNNTYLGEYAGRCTTSGNDNIGLGRYSQGTGVITGSNNITLGCKAATNLTSSSDSIVIGRDALGTEDANGSGVIAIGLEALKAQNASSNIGGTIGKNIAIGEQAGLNLVDATENVFLGYQAGQGVLGSKNIAIGSKTLQASNSGQLNVVIGLDAAKSNTGSNNVVIGGNAAAGGAGDGSDNVFLGQYSGYNISDGDKNTFLGRGTGNTVTTGCCNVLIGYNVDAVAASDKTFKIGIGADTWISGDGSFNTTLAGIVTAYASGIVSATSYYGDGSNLTGTGGGTLISGFTVQEESSNVGTAGSITILDFQGASVTATASGANKAVITVAASAGATDGWTPDSQENLVAGNGAGAARDADTCFNIMIGCNAGTALNAGDHNIFMGCNAGKSVTTGNYNTVFGSNSLRDSTDAAHTISIGYYAANQTTVGGDNIFIGSYAGMCAGDSGCSHRNIGIGCLALQYAGKAGGTYSRCNVAIGNCAGKRITTGDKNTVIGDAAYGYCDGTGGNNVFVGTAAALKVTTSNHSTFLGSYAGAYGIVTGNYNNLFGSLAGCKLTTGSHNVYLGFRSGWCNSTGSGNVLLGNYTSSDSTSASYNIAIGNKVCLPVANGDHQLAIGIGATHWITGNANFNVGIGTTNADCAVGVGNTAKLSVGIVSAYQLYGDGQYLTNVGGASTDAWAADSQENLVAGNGAGAARDADTCLNIFIGCNSGAAANEGDKNVFIGGYTGCSVTSGSNNVAIGDCSLSCNVSGDYNVALGVQAGKKYAGANGCNIYIGLRAGCGGSGTVDGVNNIMIGMNSGMAIDGGDNNIFMGCYAAKTISSGSNNIMLGDEAGCAMTTGSHNIGLGRKAMGTGILTGSYNVVFGKEAGLDATSAGCNIILGLKAGKSITAAGNNIFMGCYAGANLDGATVSTNIMIGEHAGKGTAGCTGISNNIFIGRYTGTNIQTASYNVAVGRQAGKCLTTPIFNAFFGNYSGCRVTTGGCNTFIGNKAGGGSSDITGGFNVGIGYNVEVPDATGSTQLVIGCAASHWIVGNSDFNVGIGTDYPNAAVTSANTKKLSVGIVSAYQLYVDGTAVTGGGGSWSADDQENLYAGTDAGAASDADTTYNIALGYKAGCSLNSGDYNVFFGCTAGKASTSGSSNVYIGCGAGSQNDQNNNVLIGSYAGGKLTGAADNVYIGYNTGEGLFSGTRTGSINVALGKYALAEITTGGKNVVLGCSAGNKITSGSNNIALGELALGAGAVTADNNIAIGIEAGKNATSGSTNIFIGCGTAGAGVITGDYNHMFGKNAGEELAGGYRNNAMGNSALEDLTTGRCNVAIGPQAGYKVTTGCNNITLGAFAGCLIAGGNDNIFFGDSAGRNTADANKNIFIGSCAGQTNTSGCCNVAIGYDVDLPSATGNTQFAIGLGATSWISGDSSFNIKPGAGILDNTGNVGTAGSVLASTGSGVCWVAASGGGGGGGVTVQDEGSALSTTATTINFVGSGVEATGTGATKTITISGGGGGGGASVGVSSNTNYIGTGVTNFNFVGTGITASITGSTVGNVYIPSATRTTNRYIATADQTTFSATYTVGYVDVFLNGIKLDGQDEFTATNGTSVVLTDGATVNDIVEIVAQQISANLTITGIANVVEDTTPQLGGNLDVNGKLISGTGDVNLTGIVTATTFSGGTFSGGVDLSGLLKEGVNITAGKLSDNLNIDLANGMVHLFTTTEDATALPNLVFGGSSVNAKMSTGEAITVVIIVTAAAAGFAAQLTIDSSAVTEQWLGGSAPSEGGADGYDVYTHNIIKTGDATFVVLSHLVNFT